MSKQLNDLPAVMRWCPLIYALVTNLAHNVNSEDVLSVLVYLGQLHRALCSLAGQCCLIPTTNV